jgi:hypothetical protein
MHGISVGKCVIVYLGDPREQVFGMLVQMTSSGVVVRGLSISSVDDWLRELTPEWAEESAGYGLATTFYPMHRVEKMSLDEVSYGAPPIHERFAQRTGFAFTEFLRRETEGLEPAPGDEPD